MLGSADMAPLLTELSSPTENVIVQAEDPSGAWMFNAEAWTTAVTELQTRSETYEAAT